MNARVDSLAERARTGRWRAEGGWQDLDPAAETERFGPAWLAALAGELPGAVEAALFLADGEGRLIPAARWAAARHDAAGFAAGALPLLETMVENGRPVAQQAGSLHFAGYPVTPAEGEVLAGAVVVSLALDGRDALERVMRRLHWAMPWIALHVGAGEAAEAGALGRRARAALTVLAALGPAPGGRAAGQALVNALARVMGARRVALAEMAGARARVVALSDAATFDRRMGAVRAIADAVEEAADQEAMTVVPSEGERITRFLGVLAGEAPAMVAPFAIEDRVAGALVIERAPGDDPFDGEAAALADMIAATAGPAVLAQRASERSLPAIAIGRAAAFLDRLFGPRHLGLKLAVGAIALILATAVLVTDTYRVTADARLEGAVQRALIAPFDGFIEGAEARAGDIVGAGDVLASLEEEELVLRRLRHDADRRQFDMQRARALREADVASARIAAAQMAQMEAEIALVDAMLARTRITAPFDGIVVAGDLHDAVGSPVSRGQVLFEVAPLEDWTVVLEVEEARIADLETGQTGRLLLAAFPSEPFDIVVEAITPVAATVEGAHGFEVRARLIGEDARLRPGLEGVAKIDAGEARVVWIWTRGALDWVRLKLWSLWP